MNVVQTAPRTRLIERSDHRGELAERVDAVMSDSIQGVLAHFRQPHSDLGATVHARRPVCPDSVHVGVDLNLVGVVAELEELGADRLRQGWRDLLDQRRHLVAHGQLCRELARRLSVARLDDERFDRQALVVHEHHVGAAFEALPFALDHRVAVALLTVEGLHCDGFAAEDLSPTLQSALQLLLQLFLLLRFASETSTSRTDVREPPFDVGEDGATVQERCRCDLHVDASVHSERSAAGQGGEADDLVDRRRRLADEGDDDVIARLSEKAVAFKDMVLEGPDLLAAEHDLRRAELAVEKVLVAHQRHLEAFASADDRAGFDLMFVGIIRRTQDEARKVKTRRHDDPFRG